MNTVISNMGKDRIYLIWKTLELVNKDNSIYKGKIHTRAITCQDVAGANFRSYVYETADGRWFDRAGLPIDKPKNLVTRNDGDDQQDGLPKE